MAQIIAPNKDYTGESASVTFVKGVGETSDAYLLSGSKSTGIPLLTMMSQKYRRKLLKLLKFLKPKQRPRNRSKRCRRNRREHVLQEQKQLMQNEFGGDFQEAAKAGSQRKHFDGSGVCAG